MSSRDLLHGNDQTHLEHYGTKGMRWGVRKDSGGGSRVKSAVKSFAKKQAPILFDRKTMMKNIKADPVLKFGASTIKKQLPIVFDRKGMIENMKKDPIIKLGMRAVKHQVTPGPQSLLTSGGRAKMRNDITKARNVVRDKIGNQQVKTSKILSKEAKKVRTEAKALDKKTKGFESDVKAFEANKKNSIGKIDSAVNRAGAASAKKMANRTSNQAKKKHNHADGLEAESKEYADAGKWNLEANKKSITHSFDDTSYPIFD